MNKVNVKARMTVTHCVIASLLVACSGLLHTTLVTCLCRINGHLLAQPT